jgi:uridine kinase
MYTIQARLFPEDPKYFLAPKASSYRDQNPDSETPDFVHWDAYVTDLQNCLKLGDDSTTSNTNRTTRILDVWIIDHFLLLHDPRVVQCLDVLIFLDPCYHYQNPSLDVTNTSASSATTNDYLALDDDERVTRLLLAARDNCRERRVQRDPNRLSSEQDLLRQYYNHAVWPAYLQYTHGPAQRYLAGHPDRSLRVDCGCLGSKEQILSVAVSFLQGQIRLKT